MYVNRVYIHIIWGLPRDSRSVVSGPASAFLGTCYKYRFSGPSPDLLNLKLL